MKGEADPDQGLSVGCVVLTQPHCTGTETTHLWSRTSHGSPWAGQNVHTGSLKHILLLALLLCKPISEAKIILKGQWNKKYLSTSMRGGGWWSLRTYVQMAQVCQRTPENLLLHTRANSLQNSWPARTFPGVPVTGRNPQPRSNAPLSPNKQT